MAQHLVNGGASPPKKVSERYCLYTLDERLRVWSADIHHPPWRLQPATAEIEHNTMAAPLGIGLADEPLLHFARRQDVLVWRPRLVEDVP